MNVDAATKAALLEEFGPRWMPFAFQAAWQPPQEGVERSKVFRAHWRRIYKCEHPPPPGLVPCPNAGGLA